MAGERRNYRTAAPAPAPEDEAPEQEPYEDEEEEDAEEDRPAPRRTSPSASRPTGRYPSRSTGGGGRNRTDSKDGTYVTITGLFPTKSGKADTAFVKDDMYELIRKIRPGDTIGVSVNQKTNRLQLWYITKG